MPASADILIRDAEDPDGPALAALIAGVFSEYEGVAFVPAEFPELDKIATTFRRSGGRIWIALAGDALVGSLGAAPSHRGGIAELSKVYVARAHRGKGLAGRLLALALDHLAGQGTKTVLLWSDAKFLDGHRFYRRNGFVRAPGVRALHDASETLELPFRLDLSARTAP